MADETGPIQIDFGKLENEVRNAINADEKYWRENSTKLRAIEQRVGTYEDFRQMVLAAHLKPLDKGESLKSDFNKNTWNLIASKTNPNEQLARNSNQAQFSYKQPLSSLEFVQTWKKLGSNEYESFILTSAFRIFVAKLVFPS